MNLLRPLVVAAGLAVVSPAVLPSAAAAQPYDFSEVTRLAQGAVDGQGVATPVRGFELLLMHEGEVVYHDSFGKWQNGRLANMDSSTKTLSGAVVMAATDTSARPFSLDDKLSSFLPEFAGDKRNITVRQAFSHTGGFGESEAIADRHITLQKSASIIAAEPLAFAPGRVFSYGGTGMQAAGAAAEVAAGVPWKRLAADRITGPLGMTQTRYVLSGPNNPRIAGGAESNAADIGVFMEMLRNGGKHDGEQVLSPAAVAQMFVRQTPKGVRVANSPLGNADYGVGVWLDERDADGNLTGALAGGARGFHAWIDFDDGLVGVFSTDVTSFANVRPLTNEIRDAAATAVRADPSRRPPPDSAGRRPRLRRPRA